MRKSGLSSLLDAVRPERFGISVDSNRSSWVNSISRDESRSNKSSTTAAGRPAGTKNSIKCGKTTGTNTQKHVGI